MPGLLEELRRRNVFKVGTAYVVLAWLLAQITDVFLEPFGAPDWVIKTILLVLIAGFPLALFFAWAFELTPEGLKKEKDVDRSQSITHETGQKLNLAIIFILVLALGYFAVDKFVLDPQRKTETADASAELAAATLAAVAADEKSIAVLPFVNMSEDAGNEYFSDGISEEILNSLAQVSDLKVAGRTSSFAFKGQNQDLRRIGEALGVNHILEGSVRKAGAKVRITAQLIQVEDGFHLWSATYDRELTDVFAIQDEIAHAILEQLKARLVDGESPAPAATRTSTEAYELYLLAKQRMYERTKLTIQAAADLLDKAIALDPQYAPAYAQRGIATLLLSITSYGSIPQEQALVQAKTYLDKALALDQDLAEAWAGLGLYYTGPPPQPTKGIPVLEKALSINPSLNDAGNWLSMTYWSVNRVVESLALLDGIAERDPLYKPAMGNRVFMMALMGRGDEARADLDRLSPFLPGDPQIEGTRAWIDFTEGKVADGLQRMLSAVALQPTDRTFRAGVNQGYYLTHQYELTFDDEWSDYAIWALFNLGRNEEAGILASARAAEGKVGPLFAFLNATDQSAALLQFFEQRWADLEAFMQEVPPHMFGYREMADIALAYKRSGDLAHFEEALAALRAANESSMAQGMRGPDNLLIAAAFHALAGEPDQALRWLAQAVDEGLVVSARISREYPYFRELDGDPRYEAIQARMIEHLNRERGKLGLEPVST